MSRVFEALNRARQEREGYVVQPTNGTLVDPEDNFLDEVQEFTREPEPKYNGADRRDATTAITEKPERQHSWRERIEELLFGWDLRRYASHPIVALDEDSPASEQYKMLREQLKRLRTEAGIRNIAITSPVKRDGKTTVAVNLAAAIALDYDQRVVLIDADLRAPNVHRYFSGNYTVGLVDYLGSNSHMTIDSVISATHLDGLSIVPAGKPSRFASELLAKERMAHLFSEIHARLPGHIVIVDSPPVLATPDPLVLAPQVDGVLMVVRAGKTPKEYLSKALSAFNANKVIGVVLNGADLGLSSKYYYHYSKNSA